MIEVWNIQMGIDNTDYQFVDKTEKLKSLNILDDAFQNFKSVVDI